MYTPKQFEEPRIDVLHQLMRSNPLATLVTLGEQGLNANHIPMQLVEHEAPLGILRAHIARANPLWKDFAPEVEALAIFHGPDAYISPSWYPSKAETTKVVPTWNYAVAHAYGKLRVIEDSSWLRRHLEELTNENESSFATPWKIEDAPADFIDKLITAVVGIEIQITRMQGKWKTSQNQSAGNRAGVISGLRTLAHLEGSEMANMMAAQSDSP